MSKEKVLVIDAVAVENANLLEGFTQTQNPDALLLATAKFVDRDAAETDESLRQIIPYVLLRNDDSVACYQRSKKTPEGRLAGKHSIGFGGHINPIDGTPHDTLELIDICMEREVAEEVRDTRCVTTNFLGFIRVDDNAVGKVHLGYVFEKWMVDQTISSNAADEVDRPVYKTIKELLEIE